MTKYLLPQNGNFYKANLHSHSTVSDGRNTPKEMKDYYKEHGYQILALTDHELLVDHSDLSEPDFLMLTGYEYAFVEDVPYSYARTLEINLFPKDPKNLTQICFNPKNVWHGEKWRCETLAYHGGIYERKLTKESVQEVVNEAVKHGFLVSLNHPHYSFISPEFFGKINGLFAMEVHNQGSYYNSCDYNPQMYDQMLRMGHKVFPIASDDNHRAYVYDDKIDIRPWGFNMIKAERLTYDSVIKALENGDFYASQGPQIYDLYVENGVINVKCDEVKAIIMHTKNRFFVQRHADVGCVLTSAKIIVPKDEYMWIEVVDAYGRRALTRAYYKDEMTE
ncbi:MAG: PHP domain-containing protein [Clostridia bacterium]|nr:PHP domain-containing protein [Clostridia bacterium]